MKTKRDFISRPINIFISSKIRIASILIAIIVLLVSHLQHETAQVKAQDFPVILNSLDAEDGDPQQALYVDPDGTIVISNTQHIATSEVDLYIVGDTEPNILLENHQTLPFTHGRINRLTDKLEVTSSDRIDLLIDGTDDSSHESSISLDKNGVLITGTVPTTLTVSGAISTTNIAVEGKVEVGNVNSSESGLNPFAKVHVRADEQPQAFDLTVGMLVESGAYGIFVDSPKSVGMHIANAQHIGVRVEEAATTGVRIGTTDTGFEVENARVNGLHVYSATNGILIRNAAVNGIQVDSAGEYAGNFNGAVRADILEVDERFTLGTLYPTTDPNSAKMHITTNDSQIGLRIKSDGHGILVDSAQSAGIRIITATHGIHIGQTDIHGLSIGTAGHTGVRINNAEQHGVSVGAPNIAGIYGARQDGLHVYHAGNDGIHVESAGRYAGYFNGTVRTNILEIAGGSDLAEMFEISSAEPIEAGWVVAIDPDNPGYLRVSNNAYDRTVAGVISGAGGLEAGLILQQEGTMAAGDYPVALTGRVYVWADASNGPIHPGDLLTTSDNPGHAMKVSDYERSQGAILGKAMTKLDAGTGLVLVLVSLQ